MQICACRAAPREACCGKRGLVCILLSQSCNRVGGSLEKIPITVGRGMCSLVAILPAGAANGASGSSDDGYPVPGGWRSQTGPGILRGTAGMGWCGTLMPCAHRGTGLLSCATHQPCFSGGGPNARLPPDISISGGVSLQRVKSWCCHCFPQG